MEKAALINKKDISNKSNTTARQAVHPSIHPIIDTSSTGKNRNELSKIISLSNRSEIQRKVFVGPDDSAVEMTRLKNDPMVDLMITDNIDRHFIDEKEMVDFAYNSTDYIGNIPIKNDPWVRLNPDELTVIGEVHDSTILMDIVKGIQTERYLYEGYSEFPEATPETFPEFLEANARHHQSWDRKGGMLKEQHIKDGGNKDKVSHALEHVFPKLAYALIVVKTIIDRRIASEYKEPGTEEKGTEGESIAIYFGKALFFVKDLRTQAAKKQNLSPAEKAIIEFYDSEIALFETIEKSVNGKTPIGTILERTLKKKRKIRNFCTMLIEYFANKYKELYQPPPGKLLDAIEGTKKTNKKRSYFNFDPRDDLRTWREHYMMKKITEAAAGNYIIAGMGERHVLGLKSELEAIKKKRKVVPVLMADFIALNQNKMHHIKTSARKEE